MDEFSYDTSNWIRYINQYYLDSSISNIDSSISSLQYKISDVIKTSMFDEKEEIILATDDDTKITSISINKVNDDSEKIILSTDDNIDVGCISTSYTNKNDSEVLEFCDESDTKIYAKIGTVDGSSGIFVDNIYDLNGNILLQLDPINDVMILFGKKYKLITYVEN